MNTPDPTMPTWLVNLFAMHSFEFEVASMSRRTFLIRCAKCGQEITNYIHPDESNWTRDMYPDAVVRIREGHIDDCK